MWAFFFLWLGYRRNQTWLIWVMIAFALSARSDVGLVIAMFGFVCLLARPRQPRSWLVMAAGAGWFALVVHVVVPHFSTVGFIYDENYRWLGGSLTGIIKATFTDPRYVAQGVLTPAKLKYTFDLLFPFAFLPLLKPRILIIPLPIYLLNMLSQYEHQYTINAHYQALIVPWLMIATIEALGDLACGCGPVGRKFQRTLARVRLVHASRPSVVVAGLVVVMLGCSGVQQLTIQSPVLSYLRHHGPSRRAEAGRAMLATVPPDAPLAITQKLAGNTPDRRYLYSFPGDPLYHSPALVDRADYLIGDERLSDFERQQIVRYRVDPAWQVVDEHDGFILMRRVSR